VRRAAGAALAASCLLAFAQPGLVAGDQAAGDKLPEPAHQFAKEASSRVTETEREWVKMVERLTKCQADFTVADRASTDGSLRDEASRLLASAKKLLADHKQMGTDLERFKDSLKKAASHYREVAALYKAHAAEARSAEVKDDYLQLEKAYVRKAGAAAERCEKVAMPAGAKAKAEVIEEGNLFLERLCEALAIGPVSEAERGVFVGRLKKHGERCKALAEELCRGAEKLLQDSDALEIRQKVGGASKLPRAAAWPPETSGGKKDFSSLRGASWSCPVTVSDVQCVQVIRLGYAGNCSQSVYLLGPKGKGKLVGTGSATFLLDAEGGLSFYQAGMLVERGQVTLLGKDQWSYEILENRGAPGLAGTRLTFTREP
jgi:hypothetical protein